MVNIAHLYYYADARIWFWPFAA